MKKQANKKTVGRPKGEPTITPSLRVSKTKWNALKAKYPKKVNKMFNEWVNEQLSGKAFVIAPIDISHEAIKNARIDL